MSITPIENVTSSSLAAQTQFDVALEKATAKAASEPANSEDLSDDELDQLVSQAMELGGQFIIMPMAQNLLKEAQEDDEE
ncbi:hypothetical protein [Pseudomonas fluorescens]|jgi:hypothetical protein|uniref:hypothetical protein n=1 Tax=Pseudomonas fluorescens TaxID=294 RepID=UPI0037F562C0